MDGSAYMIFLPHGVKVRKPHALVLEATSSTPSPLDQFSKYPKEKTNIPGLVIRVKKM